VVLPRLEICVVDWCKGDVFNDNGVVADRRQLKIKPRILNNGSQPINITITRPSALRLLVPLTKGPYPWKPPPRTSRAGDRVVAVSWNGHRYWAVPPNVPGDARMTPSGFYTGFATAWDGTSLPAESVYYRAVTYRNGRAVRRGDLVFELPTNSKGLIEFSALALIAPATGQVRAAHAADRWPRASDPDSF
jgi:hypothetical protein